MTLVSKAFSDIITFSRASNATRVAPNGLIQFAPHNLLLQSQTFDNASWVKTGATISANAIAAPDGTVTADGVVEDGSTGLHVAASAAVTYAATTQYVTSVYAKKATRDWLAIQVGTAVFGATTRAWFDLNNGVIGTQTNCTASIQSIGDGWFRCILSDTTTAGGAGTTVIGPASADGAQTYTGVASAIGCYIWGAQLTQGPDALDYTPTTTAAVYGPRFDYDPVTLENKGLLIEEARTNLLAHSDEFNNAAWVKSNITVAANVVLAPDGTVAGDSITESTDGGTTSHFIYHSVTLSAATAYTYSVYAKASAADRLLTLYLRDSAAVVFGNVSFNLSTGIVAITTVGTGTITAVGGGWHRCTVVGTAATGGSGLAWLWSKSSSGLDYIGNGSLVAYVWGAQLEAGAFPSSYIPTTTTSLTRAADVATINTLSPWYNQTEGTLYAEWQFISPSVSGAAGIDLYSASGLDKISIRSTSILENVGGVTQFLFSIGQMTTIVARRAVAYRQNDSQAAYNASVSSIDTSCSIGTFSKVNFNVDNGVYYPNAHLRRIAYYPVRISNNDLQALTA